MIKFILLVFVFVSVANAALNFLPSNLLRPGSCCSVTNHGPTEAFFHNNKWYQFFDCPLPWRSARNYCRTRMYINGRTVSGGELVSIANRAENQWLRWIINRHYGGDKYAIWIGLKRNTCQSSWYWTDGTSYNVFQQNWASQQPNCRWPPTETCGHLIDNYKWNDAECGDRFRFICEHRRIIATTSPPFIASPTPPLGPAFDIRDGARRRRDTEEQEDEEP